MVIGIDLGTTNSLVAVWESSGPKLVPNALGEVLTPSCVSLDEDGSILVGRAAKERLQSHPERTASVFKRYMGTDRQLRLGDRPFRAEELSALVLRSLKQDAEAYLGQPVTEAIITVPAYFSDAQRKATRAAAQLADLKVDRLLNEPTAAALAYGIHRRGEESRFLVFDLGGGTFDVSILELFEGVMEVRASAGDNFLGGEDVVSTLVDHFLKEGVVPPGVKKDTAAIQQLSAVCESLKRQLSETESASARFIYRESEILLNMHRERLEELCAPLLMRLRTPVERAVRDANLSVDQLDAIVLAGGASRMPMVRDLVTKMFGRRPAAELNPDEVVALGAAVQAGLKMKDAALNEVVMTDVSPYSLGIEVSKEIGGGRTFGHFDPLIERNSVVPISRVKRYFPTEDRQTHIDLKVYQGEARLVRDNILLGTLKIELPYGPREDAGVDVRFTYDVNGLLEVQASIVRSQKVLKLVIQGNPGLLSDEEIQARLEQLSGLKIHPRDRMENRTLLAQAERVYQLLRGEHRERFGQEITLFEMRMDSQDDHIVKPARKRLEEVIAFVESEVILKAETIQ